MSKLNDNNLSQILIRRYMIIGERRISNYWWTFIVFLGSFGFLLTGISAYFGPNIIPLNFFNKTFSSLSTTLSTDWFANSNIDVFLSAGWKIRDIATIENGFNKIETLPFFPQGLLMSFYGSLGFLLSIYWCFLIFWNVGAGFNEFNKKDGFIRIFRWGYPGKNRRIDLLYPLKDVEAIKVEFKKIGFSPIFSGEAERTIYIRLKGKREIPLTGIGQPLTLKDIEKQASELANFLQVSLEGL